MTAENHLKKLTFLREAERLKDTLRSGVTAQGRSESTAEHTWRLCLMVMVFADELPEVDLFKVIKMCLVHDLGETYAGDVPAIHQTGNDDRKAIERRDMEKLSRILDDQMGQEVFALWEEYEAGSTVEAKIAKGFDKLETMLQHTQGKNAPDFDYLFNLSYGTKQTSEHPLLAQLRKLIDAETEQLADGKRAWTL